MSNDFPVDGAYAKSSVGQVIIEQNTFELLSLLIQTNTRWKRLIASTVWVLIVLLREELLSVLLLGKSISLVLERRVTAKIAVASVVRGSECLLLLISVGLMLSPTKRGVHSPVEAALTQR